LRVDGGAGGEAVPELRVDRLPDAERDEVAFLNLFRRR